MKNLKYYKTTIIALILSALFLLLALYGCETTQNKRESYDVESTKELYETCEIVKVRNCEYVLWHNSYGSDMEHYEGCKNEEHVKMQ